GRIAQVEEGDTAVVAAAGDPSGEGDGLAGVLGTQGAGFMGTEHVSGVPCPGRACWYRDPGGTGAPPGGQPVQVWAGASSRCHHTFVAPSPDHRACEVRPLVRPPYARARGCSMRAGRHSATERAEQHGSRSLAAARTPYS